MAKKRTSKPAAPSFLSMDAKPAKAAKLTEKDLRTVEKIRNLAGGISQSAAEREDPLISIPSRSLSNVWFNEIDRIIEMGDKTTARTLFNLSQARSFMQTLLIAEGANQLISQGKTLSIRGMYYQAKHTIKGVKEETFNDQSESDPIIEDLEVILSTLREELHLYAQKRGDMVGNITLIDRGDRIDCSRMGSGGYGIPSIVEPEVITLDPKLCKADFVLHVEKDTVWQRFNEDKFWKKHNCILTHGGGQPSRGVRRLLYRLNRELGLPIYCLLDNDPWGYYIYSVIKQGSINLAFESKRMAVPEAKFIGIRSDDFEMCGLTPSVTIALNDNDRKRAKQIAEYPWFADKKPWQDEIAKMMKHGFKMEVESLISKGITYVTEIYTPAKIEAIRARKPDACLD
ncbi:MAG: DNA topoisomerase IV subunit A [Thermoguttaceae bacterium]|nr:DNA topoisomerase IV subunit A [Thermoguttaceae bacterium]